MMTNTPLTRRVNPIHPETDELVNHIALVIDDSASMSGWRDKALDVFNRQIDTVKVQSRETGQKTTMSVFKFSVEPTPLRTFAYPESCDRLARQEYGANGRSTALRDAVKLAVKTLQSARDAKAKNTSFLVITVTDGEENSSVTGQSALTELIDSCNKTDRWSFAYLVPPGRKAQTASALRVPEGNVKEWEQSEKGLREMAASLDYGTHAYYDSRSLGATRTSSFFTDLSKVPQAKVAAITDVTSDFKRIPIDYESDIASFVKAKRIPFELGRGYYELTKTEKIQSHKDILIEDRATKRLHGGPEARKLLGITAGPGVICKVTPKNHAGYRIFVSSTSTNRKLVRGTELLYKVA